MIVTVSISLYLELVCFGVFVLMFTKPCVENPGDENAPSECEEKEDPPNSGLFFTLCQPSSYCSVFLIISLCYNMTGLD